MKRIMGVVATSFALAACQGPAVNGVERTAVENNPLGITQLEIEHRVVGVDRFLDLRGLGDNDAVIATATLRTGMVLYSPEPDVNPEAWSAGTELAVAVGAQSAAFTSPDRENHAVREPDETELASFVRLHAVAAEIDAEAGIRFARAGSDGEVALAAGACTGSRFPTTIGNPKQCCQDGNATWHKIGTGSSKTDMLGYRTYSTACRTSGGATGCTDATPCYYGPCGSHTETITGSNTTAAAVFVPTNFPTQCGRDSNGGTAGGGMEAPQAYASQSLYAATTATCPYTACATNGAAGIHITLTASCQVSSGPLVGSETVTWNGNTVTCFYAGPSTVSQTFWAPYNAAATVTHSASGWWTGWTGGTCSGTGTCAPTVTHDVTIQANFDKDVCPTC